MEMYIGQEYWKNYMVKFWGEELIDKSKSIEVAWITSGKQTIHLDVYDAKKQKPTIVFVHGLVGHGRMMLPFLMPLFERGYNIVAPDLTGYGITPGLRGDFTWNSWLKVVNETIEYARKRFGNPIIVSGASMGGPIAYATASRYQNVDGIISYCLWDLQNPNFIKAVIRLGNFSYPVLQILRVIALILPKFRFSNSLLINYNNLTDSDEMNKMLQFKDDTTTTLISIRAAVSLLTQSKWEIQPEVHNIAPFGT